MKDEKTLLNEIKKQCGDCEAWIGTDCTRNPYAQGCLKDEKQVIECHGMLKGCDMVQQAVKNTAKEIFQELYNETINDGIPAVYCMLTPKEIKDRAKRYGVEVE